MKKHAFKQDLNDLLSKYEVDKYSGLHNYMMSEHIVRWIDEYIREQNVAKNWSRSAEPQTSYYDYMKQNGDPNGIQSNTGARTSSSKGEQGS